MSDALKYLMQVRAEAMQDYFSFLKKSGSHLDEKTRAIISVITKVDKQTESGLRQYLKRALNAGVSANEIIDALFVAFPSLGLSKIVWATEIILQMDLPEFQTDALTREKKWHAICAPSALDQGLNYLADCDGDNIFVYVHDDEVNVYASRCPHQSASLSMESLEEKTLVCPGHGWRFNAETGKSMDSEKPGLLEFESKIENNTLFAYW